MSPISNPCIFLAKSLTLSIAVLAGGGGGGVKATHFVCTSHGASFHSSSSSESQHVDFILVPYVSSIDLRRLAIGSFKSVLNASSEKMKCPASRTFSKLVASFLV